MVEFSSPKGKTEVRALVGPHMEYNNIWFYTLSTAAQVLAALAGLFAVFVVWKMQDSEKILSEIRLAVIDIFYKTSKNTDNFNAIELEILHSMLDSEILRKFSELLLIKKTEPHRISFLQSIRSDNFIVYSLDEFTENIYRAYINKKLYILERLKSILVKNFSIVGICIVALTFSNIIYYKPTILVIICILVLYCLFIISRGIYVITIE